MILGTTVPIFVFSTILGATIPIFVFSMILPNFMLSTISGTTVPIFVFSMILPNFVFSTILGTAFKNRNGDFIKSQESNEILDNRFPKTKFPIGNENFIIIPDSTCLNFQFHIAR